MTSSKPKTIFDKNFLFERADWLLLKQNKNSNVFKAFCPQLDTYVIVKELHLKNAGKRIFFSRKEKSLKTFLAENQASDYPRLEASCLFPEENEGYFVYQFLPGNNLQSGDFSSYEKEDYARLGESVGSLLGRMHLKGWVHGDLKFANVIVDQKQVYLIDLEAVRKPQIFKSSEKARDIARFVLNSLESDSPAILAQSFWRSYQQTCKSDQLQTLKLVNRWLRKIGRRHYKKYGIRVDYPVESFWSQ